MIYAILVCSCFLLSKVSAFGAGNIPSYGALEGLAFRHGDIEDILLQLSMAPVSAGVSGLLAALNPISSHGKKFNAMAVKRVYFGNFLRDYSQAIDVGTLSKGIDAKAIKLLVWVMSFMAFGYATEEFEVTEARLGVYRPEEHIDNPKGYPSPEEPDARKFDQRLRGPVHNMELEIDPETGMKNYIANERGGWMTSAAYIRNSLLRCIELGREYQRSNQKAVKYESLRILGQALHTLEDFPAHSNYVELALIELGHHQVFPQVGLATKVKLGRKEVFPLTTGTFGGLDFVHSLLGEATDKLSQTQISDLSDGLATSSAHGSSGLFTNLQSLASNIPGSLMLPRDIDEMSSVSRYADQMRSEQTLRAGPAVNIDPDEIGRTIYPVMAFRDRMMKTLSAFFEKIPGLSSLIDRISENLTIWVLSTIEPFMKPIVDKIKTGLAAGQALVTSKNDQLAVFEDASCSDPTHSMLAKDHFSCYLNQPAGLCGQAIVKHVAVRITAAWADSSINPLQLVDEILEAMHHPAAPTGRTPIQNEMRVIVEHWFNNLGSKKARVSQGLTFEGTKNGLHHEGGNINTTGVWANHSHSASATGSSDTSGAYRQARPDNGSSNFYHDSGNSAPSNSSYWNPAANHYQANPNQPGGAFGAAAGYAPAASQYYDSAQTYTNEPYGRSDNIDEPRTDFAPSRFQSAGMDNDPYGGRNNRYY